MSEVELNKEFFDDLIKDTDFVMADTGSLMSSRIKVSTPILALNCIWGGGLPLGIISEVSGPPQSGKSTFLYQCMGRYQKEQPDGVAVIYDLEASMDDGRLQDLGIDTSKALRLPSSSMQNAFANMFKMMNKIEDIKEKIPDISMFQIYDSLGSGGTDKQHEATEKGNNVFGTGTMMEEPRILKSNLKNVFPYLEKFPIFLGLINQVSTQINSYGGASVGSGGGFSLKHLAHVHIEFKGNPQDTYEKGFIVGTQSNIIMKKSKLSPKFTDIPCYIDITKGGIIDEAKSFGLYLVNIGMIKTGSWYSISDTIDYLINTYPDLDIPEVQAFKKNIRKDDLYRVMGEDQDLLKLLQIAFIDKIDTIYPAQREVNNDYQMKLIEECKYFHMKEKTAAERLGEMLGMNTDTQDNSFDSNE